MAIDILLTSMNKSVLEDGVFVWIYASLQNMYNYDEFETATCLVQYLRDEKKP